MQSAKQILSLSYKISRYQHRLQRVTRQLSVRLSHTGTEVPPSAASIPPPPVADEQKEYSPKIQSLVQSIGNLTLLEVADLNDLLKKTLKIQDAPMMAMGAAAAPVKEEEEVAPEQVKSLFTVKLVKFDEAKKVPLIKEIKLLMEGMNLVQAKKFVDAVPQVVQADLTKEDADKLKAALEAVGATIELE